MATGKKTGGRRKGTPNRRTAEMRAEMAASGEMPLDYMLRIMRDPTTQPHRRDAMAKAAAPYVHPTLAAVAHKHLDAQGQPMAPVVTVTIMQAPPETPRLTVEGPKDDDTVQ
jgi:hypothetical protein